MAKPDPLIGARRYIQRSQPVDGVERRRPRIDAGRERGPVGAQTPVLDQKHFIAIDGGGLLCDNQRPWP
jgi:hypothetical protein